MKNIYDILNEINIKPEVWSHYTAEKLWNDPHISRHMLDLHLDEDIDPASRKKKFIDKSLVWIIDKFYIKDETTIADFGCGPGLYAIPFAEKGAQVTAIDFSKRSITYAQEAARENELPINFHNINYLDFTTDKKYDLITMIYCDYCALNPEQRKTLMIKFNNILKDDGSVLLDVFSLSAYEDREEEAVYEKNLMEGFWSGKDYFGFSNTFKYDVEKVVCDKYTIFEQSSSWQIYNWLQYFSLESLKNELSQSQLIVSEYYGDVKGSPYSEQSMEIAVILKKQQ